MYAVSRRFLAQYALLTLAACLPAARLSAQTLATDNKPVLTVNGTSDKPALLRMADLNKLSRKSVKVHDPSGQESVYEGIPLADVMKQAGMDFQSNLHGRGLTKYLLVEAADKYRVVFALPEFDPAFTDRLILLASRRDGKPLSPEEGTLRLIVPDDKRQARYVRQVRSLTLIDAVTPAERNKKP